MEAQAAQPGKVREELGKEEPESSNPGRWLFQCSQYSIVTNCRTTMFQKNKDGGMERDVGGGYAMAGREGCWCGQVLFIELISGNSHLMEHRADIAGGPACRRVTKGGTLWPESILALKATARNLLRAWLRIFYACVRGGRMVISVVLLQGRHHPSPRGGAKPGLSKKLDIITSRRISGKIGGRTGRWDFYFLYGKTVGTAALAYLAMLRMGLI